MTTTETTTQQQWTVTAGPRQIKAVNDALNALKWRCQTYTEITGVIGGEERRFQYQSPLAAPSPDYKSAIQRVGDQFDWSVTRDNYQQVADAITREMHAIELPVVDKRITQEQAAQQQVEREIREEAQRNELADKERHQKEIAAKLRRDNPWVLPNDGKMSTHARASKNLKIELTRTFPGIDFSVRSDSFSMGNSIDVSWLNGPTDKEVSEVTSKYVSGHFDGMEDYYKDDYSPEGQACDEVFGRAKYVSTHRKIADADCELIRADIAAKSDAMQPYELDRRMHEAIANTSLPPAATITGAKWNDDNKLVVTFDAPAVALEPTTTHVEGSGEWEVQKHFHTKRQFDFFLVVWPNRVSNFDELRRSAEAIGGWYSRKWGKTPGGMAFLSDSLARDWASANLGRPDSQPQG